MRIDKYFSSLGLLSRSECKKAVKAGQITVNGIPAKSPDSQIDPASDRICLNGNPVIYEEYSYYILNKPAGYVTARSDSRDKTIFDLVSDKRPDLSAVGRLDKDTTGILLITNDGQLNHRLLSAKYHVPKTYIVTAEGTVTPEDINHLRSGIDIGDENPTLPAEALLISSAETESIVSLTIYEGRYHQVKRMFQAVGKPVIRLHRKSFGPLVLDPGLNEGDIIKLSDDEVVLLKAACNLPGQ